MAPVWTNGRLPASRALRQWRADVAREHNLPAYVVFHDATLAEMARRQPASLAELGGISGVGAKKLEAYGTALLQVLEEESVNFRQVCTPLNRGHRWYQLVQLQ